MGVVIALPDHRRTATPRASRARQRPVFAFDLASPDTYLAAERADRLFGDLDWRPVLLPGPTRPPDPQRARRRAAALGLPLVCSATDPIAARAAMRVAALAARRGRAASFVLAATRLAFCGGFALDDPECLAEAAAAAGLSLHETLRAAADPATDAELASAGRALRARGVDHLPALEIAGRVLCGEERIAEAAALAAMAPRTCGGADQRSLRAGGIHVPPEAL